MFSETIHRQILQILHCLNAELLKDCRAYFGGGTQMVMSLGEYRLSRAIDFLCPYGANYSCLRRAIFDESYDALFTKPRRNHPTEISDHAQMNDASRVK